MAGVITTGNHPKLLWPGLQSLFGSAYNDYPMECTQIFDESTSEKHREEDQELYGFGLAQVKPEGDAISYDTHQQGWTKTYRHIVYGLGFIETRESVEDNLYKGRSRRRTRLLARSMAITKETVCANVLNLATDSNYVGGDGKELLATDHPTVNGTQSNELTVAADLSEASIEDLIIQINGATDTRGLKIKLMPKKLVVPPALQFEAQRILKSELQNDTANNATNALRGMNIFPEGYMVYHYLTDADQWFVKTDAPDGLKLIKRRGVSFDKDSDFDTDNFKHKATERYSVGWTDWRAVWGSPGA